MSKQPIIENITQYIAELNRIYKAGNATEHSYRLALQRLWDNITTGLTITNEPKRIACGAPDYIVTRKEIPIGYIEAKDINTDLNSKANKPQFDRYKLSLNNLIITDYLTFQFFENGELITFVTIAKTSKNGIEADKTQFERFIALINLFVGYQGQGIQTSMQLSKAMAAKARLMANSLEKALDSNENTDGNSLYGQLTGFRKVLIPDISHKEFADMYAQTIAYGMFAAKLNDTSPNPSEGGELTPPPLGRAGEGLFTRNKAAQFIPLSNPFLRKFFQYIADYDLDERICWVVDDLADLFNYVDINAITKEFDKADHDPIIHFYETFLAEYDPALRKSRGVWYTPQSAVQFIVQIVDDILKQDFKLPQGLADTSKVKKKQNIEQNDGTIKEEEKEYHRVQILDPATGTGTFLTEVVQNIYQRFKKQQGMWQNYAHEHLIPRINGFEILMVSYAMAHLKLDMLLKQTGYKYYGNERLPIFLTNSLEQAQGKAETLFVKWLSDEANDASRIKKDVPVMVVLGNPPYNVSTQNKNSWIDGLTVDYKKGLNEKKINLDDDYIKFIRYGQNYIQNNGDGILAYISNNSFIDGVTHRQMRKSLLETFDKIYIIDLHGNARKKETAPDGSKDENIFDIMQGVSINIFVKSKQKTKNKLAEVYHFSLYGKRNEKFSFLLNNNLQTVKWKELQPHTPYYFFVPKDFSLRDEYEKGINVAELFVQRVAGFETMGDNFIIANDKNVLVNRITKLLNREYNEKELNETYSLGKNYSNWIFKNLPRVKFDASKFVQINYRLFDKRWTYYESLLIWRCRENVMKHLFLGENIGMIVKRGFDPSSSAPIFVSNSIIDRRMWSCPGMQGSESIFPLYLYHEGDIENGVRMPDKKTPNLDKKIINEISQRLGLQFTEEKQKTKKTFTPIDILDYIYAVLHSPTYREKYKEFLKIDFPRVPYPENAKQFWKMVELGGKLRRLHLLEDVEPQEGMADFPIAGSDEVEKPQYVGDKVYINDTQYFDNVPLTAWNFYIGGYQPAQKWLKDRKGLKLSYDNIVHYQKIIRVLVETGDVMEMIEKADK